MQTNQLNVRLDQVTKSRIDRMQKAYGTTYKDLVTNLIDSHWHRHQDHIAELLEHQARVEESKNLLKSRQLNILDA